MNVIFVIFLTAFFVVGVLAFGIISVVSFFSFAPYVPTRKKDLQSIVDAIDLREGEVMVDLGCGDGRVVAAVARRLSGARVIGVELTWHWALVSRWHTWRQPNAHIVRKNFYSMNVSDADVVYLFGYPTQNGKRIKEKLERELKIGARVVSYVFPIPGWTEERIVVTPAGKKLHVYRR